MRKKKGKASTIFLIIALLVGLSVMLYPLISDWWNSHTQSRAIEAYQAKADGLKEEEYKKILAQAHDYNDRLGNLPAPLVQYQQLTDYNQTLDITGTGIMGYISIPKISCELPIYHGTSKTVLSLGVGHLEGSSLPVGGKSTHAVLSAHRGLPSAKLFSDLDQLTVGDVFTISVLNELYTYQVDKIQIVLPEEVDKLYIEDGQDYVTLMTCTPYGVNTHRLLVRGRRIDNEEAVSIMALEDGHLIKSEYVMLMIMAPLVLLLLIKWVFGKSKNHDVDEIAKSIIAGKENNKENG